MPVLRRSLSCVLLFPLIALTGCAMFSSDAWQRPSPLSGPPPPDVKREKHEMQGGLSVLVEGPGQPAAARVIKDLGAFAQQRGFVRQGGQPGADRYVFEKIVLDVAFRSADSHVVATLHSFGLGHKFVDRFYHDFNQQYAPQYGEEDPIIENDFSDDQDDASAANGGGRGGGRGGRR